MASAVEILAIPDIQNLPDTRGLSLKKAGIRDYRHPLVIELSPGFQQQVLGHCNLSVGLNATVKGTHMSRFVEVLNDFNLPLSFSTVPFLLTQLQQELKAREAYVDITFPYWRFKSSPVSRKESVMDYEVSLQARAEDRQQALELHLTVPVTTLCPCSKAISRYGAHNQRSLVRLRMELKAPCDLHALIDLVEAQSSCELYGLLKRSDEKFITERAYENPKFVEDLVRDIALALNRVPDIGHYQVEAENLESIHNHSAYALLERSDS